jgi:hypothetical protein
MKAYLERAGDRRGMQSLNILVELHTSNEAFKSDFARVAQRELKYLVEAKDQSDWHAMRITAYDPITETVSVDGSFADQEDYDGKSGHLAKIPVATLFRALHYDEPPRPSGTTTGPIHPPLSPVRPEIPKTDGQILTDTIKAARADDKLDWDFILERVRDAYRDGSIDNLIVDINKQMKGSEKSFGIENLPNNRFAVFIKDDVTSKTRGTVGRYPSKPTRKEAIVLKDGSAATAHKDDAGRLYEIDYQTGQKLYVNRDDDSNALAVSGPFAAVRRNSVQSPWTGLNGARDFNIVGDELQANFGPLEQQVWKPDGTIQFTLSNPDQTLKARITGRAIPGERPMLERVDYGDGTHLDFEHDKLGPTKIKEWDNITWTRISTPGQHGIAKWQSNDGQQWEGKLVIDFPQSLNEMPTLAYSAYNLQRQIWKGVYSVQQFIIPRDQNLLEKRRF